MTPVSLRVKKRRDTLRKSGLRPVRIRVPDTRRPGVAGECRRQSLLVAASDEAQSGSRGSLGAMLQDVDDGNA